MTQPPARWLATPSRFAGIGRRGARIWLCALTILLLVSALIGQAAAPAPEFLHDAIVATIRHGGDYYDVARDLLRTDPDARAARLFPAALAIVDAALPGPLMLALVAVTMTLLLWLGGLRLGALFARSAAVVMVVSLLAAGIAALAALWTAAPHAASAATLSALAIVLRGRGHWLAASATACAAAIIDPGALLTIAVMALCALADGGRREAGGWLAAALAAAAVLAIHLHALSGVAIAGGIGDHDALARLIGSALPGVPAAIAAPLLLLSLYGWAAVRDGIGPRIILLLVAGVALDGIWGIRTATLASAFVAPGIALAPGALADLARAALDRRRITVTRVVR